MSVHFTLEELAVIASYEPEKGRMSTSMKIAESLLIEDNKAVAALLRSVLAKLCICSDQEFNNLNYPGSSCSV